MGRAPCCDKANVKRGPWSPEEDTKLKDYLEKHGTGGNWIALPQKAGLRRCGKSCRLRWLNYLRPNIKHGEFTDDEDRIICSLFSSIGSRWSIIAAQLPGRTDNDIKNYWNTKLKKKLIGINPPNQNQYPLRYTSNNNNRSVLQNYAPSSQYATINTNISPPYEQNNYYSKMPFSTLVSPFLQDGCLDPTLVTYNQTTQSNNTGNFIVFGTDAASCSSSDGSCITNHVMQGLDYVERDHVQNLDLQSYFTNGIEIGGNDLIGYGGDEKTVPNDFYGENPLNYSIEEIKQLISSNDISSNFFTDDVKAEEKEIYY